MKTFKILGISTEVETCECCGKTDLMMTIKMENMMDGTFAHFGTTCASKASNWTSEDDMKEVKSSVNRLKREIREKKETAWRKAQFLMKKKHTDLFVQKENATSIHDTTINPKHRNEFNTLCDELVSKAFAA